MSVQSTCATLDIHLLAKGIANAISAVIESWYFSSAARIHCSFFNVCGGVLEKKMAMRGFKMLQLYLLYYVAGVVFFPLCFFMAVTDLAACWAS